MTRPKIIGSSMLTIFPESELYQEIQAGNWARGGELEKLAQNSKILIENLVYFLYFSASLGPSKCCMGTGKSAER